MEMHINAQFGIINKSRLEKKKKTDFNVNWFGNFG